jgi:anthranilate phosphoribosyltransferase
MGIRTIFNILGPLTNPAGAERQVLGVYDDSLTEPLAQVLSNLGIRHAFVVHGEDGLDEITNADRTKISEVKEGRIDNYFISPEDLDLDRVRKEDLLGGNAEENAQITVAILEGEKGPKRDIVLMNAAAALITGDSVSSFSEGIEKAAGAIDSGAARDKLDEVKVATNRL